MPILLLKLCIKKKIQNPLGIDLIFFKQLNQQFPRTRIGRLLNRCYRGKACLITSSVETASFKKSDSDSLSQSCAAHGAKYPRSQHSQMGFLTAEFLRASPRPIGIANTTERVYALFSQLIWPLSSYSPSYSMFSLSF